MSSEDDKTEIPTDPQYDGEVVVKDEQNKGLFGFFNNAAEDKEQVEENVEEKVEEQVEEQVEEKVEEQVEEKVEESKNEETNEGSSGFLTTLLGTGKPDCELLLRKMRDCVNEKNGTTMCKLEVDEWEKHCNESKIVESEENTESETQDSDDE
jgi:predicted RNA-binding protein Jag